MILKCECTADRYGNSSAAKYQDKKYGDQMRVHNSGQKTGDNITYTCTVCSKSRGK